MRLRRQKTRRKKTHWQPEKPKRALSQCGTASLLSDSASPLFIETSGWMRAVHIQQTHSTDPQADQLYRHKKLGLRSKKERTKVQTSPVASPIKEPK